MLRIAVLMLLCTVGVHCLGDLCIDGVSTPIYRFTVEDHEGKAAPLSRFAGDTLLIVNVASFSRFSCQYEALDELQRNHTSFHVLAFPCFQLGAAEPAKNRTELMNGLRHVRPGRGFTPSFHLFNMTDVNGKSEHALFGYLKSSCPSSDRYEMVSKGNMLWQPTRNSDIRDNFEKFLIRPNGIPYKRYAPSVSPEMIRDDIAQLKNSASPLQDRPILMLVLVALVYAFKSSC